MESSTVLTNGQLSPEYKKIDKASEAVSFLKDLYTYPPKFKITWEQLDDLNQQTKVKSKLNYDNTAYLKGYKNTIFSSNFYKKGIKPLTNSLEEVSVYTIVNDFGEIITASSSLSPIHFVNEDYDGPAPVSSEFGRSAGQVPNLGLFFFNKDDATIYLTEIARIDPRGTTTLGLSVQCISLRSAYELTREYHSNLDFRFIPDLNEVTNLLETKKSKFVFVDIKQNQPHSHKTKESLISSFVNVDNNSIKGVPIYFVQVQNSNVKEIRSSNDTLTYVCFEKEYAVKLTKKFKRQRQLCHGSRLAHNEKIYVSNLEDFLESWEESILNSTGLDKFQNIRFRQSADSKQLLDESLQNPNQESYKEFLLKQFNTKFRLLGEFINSFIVG